MSRTKKDTTPHYELLYIVSNKFTETEVKPIVEKVNKIITDNEGEITYSEDWGKKKLAYPIKNFYQGYYSLVEFDIAGEKTAIINRSFKLMEEILRFQIIAKKKRTAEEMAKEKRDAEKRLAESEEEKQPAKKEKIKEKTPDKKVDLDELDNKLDKILETNDLL